MNAEERAAAVDTIRRELLALRAERDETDELVNFLRRRGTVLNAELRTITAKAAELEAENADLRQKVANIPAPERES